MFEIKRYTSADAAFWNDFVERSKNGTFLFNRNYMDYHSDRFSDNSLMFYLDGELYAMLPANRRGDTLYSHQGLTYGGLITNEKASAAGVVSLFTELIEYLKAEGIKTVIYKATPWIYHRLPAEEDLYALFKVCHAQLIACDISSTIDLANAPRWSHGRIYDANKARRNGITIRRADSPEAFWHILDGNLTAKYGVHPVHSLEELKLLTSRFPENIRTYEALLNDTVLGGTVLYINRDIVHTQYISASPEGKRQHALDLLFDFLIHEEFKNMKYLDFGKSTEEGGTILNESLIFQKEGFGGRGMCYSTFQLTIDN